MADKKQVVWTVKLTTDGPIDPAKITDALKEIGSPEIVTYRVVKVK